MAGPDSSCQVAGSTILVVLAVLLSGCSQSDTPADAVPDGNDDPATEPEPAGEESGPGEGDPPAEGSSGAEPGASDADSQAPARAPATQVFPVDWEDEIGPGIFVYAAVSAVVVGDYTSRHWPSFEGNATHLNVTLEWDADSDLTYYLGFQAYWDDGTEIDYINGTYGTSPLKLDLEGPGWPGLYLRVYNPLVGAPFTYVEGSLPQSFQVTGSILSLLDS